MKISKKLSYPVGAEFISVALTPVPQLTELRLHSYWRSDHALRRGHYEFLRVEYLNNVRAIQEWPIGDLYKRPVQGRWEIVVRPVPRTVRRRVKDYITHFALTQIAQWLAARKELTQQGGDVLAFFYDEKSDDLVVRQISRLEPLR